MCDVSLSVDLADHGRLKTSGKRSRALGQAVNVCTGPLFRQYRSLLLYSCMEMEMALHDWERRAMERIRVICRLVQTPLGASCTTVTGLLVRWLVNVQ